MKSVLEVKIRIDPLPGWGDSPKDHVKLLQDYLSKTIPWYEPEVKLIRTEEDVHGR